jgi:hypothetical protein
MYEYIFVYIVLRLIIIIIKANPFFKDNEFNFRMITVIIS